LVLIYQLPVLLLLWAPYLVLNLVHLLVLIPYLLVLPCQELVLHADVAQTCLLAVFVV